MTKRTPTKRPAYTYDKSLVTNAFAIDTETTGLDFRVPLRHQHNPTKPFKHAALAFAVTVFDLQTHDTYYWDWPVDPTTRRVNYVQADIKAIAKLLQTRKHWIFHNAGHDIRALLLAGILTDKSLDQRWSYIHDTLPASHVLDSQESHALKDLAVKYCGIDTADEEALQSVVKQCRRDVPKDFPLCDEWQADYWLPAHRIEGDDSCRTYCVNDGIRTGMLWKIQVHQLFNPAHTDSLGQLPWHHYSREQQLIRETYEMENAGIHIRPGTFNRLRSDLTKITSTAWGKMATIAKRYKIGGKDGSDYNPRSAPQKQALLFSPQGFNLPILARTKTKQPSTSAAVLEDLHLILSAPESAAQKHGKTILPRGTTRQRALEYLETHSLYQSNNTALSYLNSYDEHKVPVRVQDGKWTRTRDFLYPSFNQNGTRTTRYSSNNPNGQNFGGRDIEDETETEVGDSEESVTARKRRTRDIAGPPPGCCWYAIDWNQLELRIMAKASGDPNLNRCLNDGIDRHQLTCDAINAVRSSLGLGKISRKIAKNINFAWQYGAGAPKLGKMAGIDARDFRLAMQSAYPGVLDFMNSCAAFSKKHGYIETLFGYRLQIPPPTYLDFDEDGDDSGTGRLIEYWYKSTNYCIQGTAGDLAKNAMLAIKNFMRKEDITDTHKLLMQIHDELLFQVPAHHDPDIILSFQDEMEHAGHPIHLKTPAEVSIIKTSWGQPKKLPRKSTTFTA